MPQMRGFELIQDFAGEALFDSHSGPVGATERVKGVG
jgi:hypothetical protein